jgi:hypothetical protein
MGPKHPLGTLGIMEGNVGDGSCDGSCIYDGEERGRLG